MKLLVLGAESQLGTALTRILQEQHVEHAVLATDELDLLKQMDLLKKVTRNSPTQVINATSSITPEQADKMRAARGMPPVESRASVTVSTR